MKVYISADIEGVCGMAAPEEANPDHKDIQYFAEQMTFEVAAACEGALNAGASEVMVKDAHWGGRNINPRKLPRQVSIIRGWTGHPFSMMAELDNTFAAVCYVGYHARAGSAGNPLAHTMSGSVVQELRLNGEPVSEFRLNTLTATMLGVPAVFLAGDEALCAEVRQYNEQVITVPTMKGVGTATVSIHPDLAVERIRSGVAEALGRLRGFSMRPLPASFHVEIDYKHPRQAYGRSFYPGARLKAEHTVSFDTTEYFDVLRMIHFCLK